MQFVIFRLNSQRFAVRLDAVERFVRAVEVTPLPGAPEIVIGVINLAGRIIPILNLRRRLGLSEQKIGPDDQFLIAKTRHRQVALVVDEAQAIIAPPETDFVESDRFVPGLQHIQGLIKLQDGLVLIHDLETFLSLDEEQSLSTAMNLLASDAS